MAPLLSQRVFCYLLMVLVCPAILFTFFIIFGSDSYQLWWEKFLYEITNRYLFSQFASDSVWRPLWREDIFGGNIWALSMGPAPLALPVITGRLFNLSPLGIDLVGTLTLYFAAVVSMYGYLRKVLTVTRESATVSAAMFGVTAYWIATTEGNPEVPMGMASLPALLVMAHRIDHATLIGHWRDVVVAISGMALIVYFFAIHSHINVLSIALMLAVLYSWLIFGLKRSFMWVVLALGLGVVLYSPFLWPIIEAAKISRRYVLTDVYSSSLYTQSVLAPQRVFEKATQILSRMAAGYNEYGMYLVTVTVILVWMALGPRLRQEQARTRRILQVVIGMSIAGYVAELFHEHINYAKQHVPLLGGWSSYRVIFFSSFGLLAALALMLDRSLMYRTDGVITPRRRAVFRATIVVLGILVSLRIAYSAYRMRLVPTSIYPQNLILYAYLILFAIITLSWLAWLYRGVRGPQGVNLCGTDSGRLCGVALMVLSVSLVTSVHAYRPGVLPSEARASIHPLPMLTYAQRYRVPDEILTIKRLNVSDSRVLDLTRPWYDPQLGVMGEAPLLALGGLRVPSGYNALFPAWYHRFVNVGINGGRGSLEKNLDLGKTLLQVEDTGDTNFEALGLLDVQYVLASKGSRLPGYVPIRSFESTGKTLYEVEDPGRIGPAFVSQEVRCFSSDAKALDYIHRGSLRELQARAVLVSGDAGVGSLCGGGQTPNSLEPMAPSPIQVNRHTDRVSLEVEGNGGILTLSDTYYPGWRVVVDGAEKPLLRTYTTFRGVVIEPGRHSVEFIYDPRLFHVLFKVSNGLLLLLLVTVFVAWRREQSKVSSRGILSHVQP